MTGKEGLRIETRIIRGGAGNKNDKPNSQKFITSDIALWKRVEDVQKNNYFLHEKQFLVAQELSYLFNTDSRIFFLKIFREEVLLISSSRLFHKLGSI